MRSIFRKKLRFFAIFTMIFISTIGFQVYPGFKGDHSFQKEDSARLKEVKRSSINPIWNYTIDGSVMEVAISEDGKYIAVGGADKNFYLFQNTSSTPIWSYTASESIESVAISANGSLIVVGTDGSFGTSWVYLFNKSSSTPLWNYSTNANNVQSVAISANGQYIVAGMDRVILFHYSSSTPIWINATYYSGSVAISDDGNYIVAGGSSPTTFVSLFNRSSSSPIWTYQTGQILSVDISPSGNHIVVASGDKNIYYFNKTNPTPIWNYSTDESMRSVAISKNEKYIVAGGGDNKICLFKNLSSTPLWSYDTGEYMKSVAISDDGRFIVAISYEMNYESHIYYFENMSSNPLWIYSTEGRLLTVGMSSSGGQIVAGSSSNDNKVYFFNINPYKILRIYSDADDPDVDGSFNIYWNYLTGAQNYSLYSHSSYISTINDSVPLIESGIIQNNYAVSVPDNITYYFKVIGLGKNNNISSNCIKVKVVEEDINPNVIIENYNSQVEFLQGSLSVNATVSDNDVLAEVKLIIIKYYDENNRIYNMTHLFGDLYTLTWNATYESPRNYTFIIYAEDIWGNINDTESGVFEIVNTHQKVPLWTNLSGERIQVKMSEDGKYIVAGSSDMIYFFINSNSTPLWNYSMPGGVGDISISSNGSYFVIEYRRGGDNDLLLFHKSSSTPLWNYSTNSNIYSMAISADGNYIVASLSNKKLQLFHKSSSIPLWTFNASYSIGTVAISGDGNAISAIQGSIGGLNEKLYYFENLSSTPLWNFTINTRLASMSLSYDGNYIVVGSGDPEFNIFLFNKLNSTPVWIYQTGGFAVYSVDISPYGNYIVAGIENGGGKVFLFNRTSSTPVWSYLTGPATHINSIAISFDSNYIIAGNWEYIWVNHLDYGNIYFFKRTSNIPLWHYRTGTYVNSVDISSNGMYSVGGSDEGIHFFQNLGPPSSFILSSDAEYPDSDGEFNLNWDAAENAYNYSVYQHSSFITEINESLIIIADEIMDLTFPLTGYLNGTYYFIIVAKNEYGETMSNCFYVNVQVPIIITIHSPLPDDLFGTSPPSFNITILGVSLNETWYTLDDGITNITFIGFTGIIEQTEWDKRGDGTITIRFYINDSSGYIYYTEVLVNKDTTAPIINIISPTTNQVFNISAPNFIVEITEAFLERMWYTLDDGITNISISDFMGSINEAAWALLPEGNVTIIFFASDTIGNIGHGGVRVIKTTTQEPTLPASIPGYNLFLIFVMIIIVKIFISTTKRKKLLS